MAKGVGLIGNLSGKLGNSVGYTVRNSNNKATQGFRVYQPKVKNPQTDLQMVQRIKMAAITNFYRQFRNIIRRGQEGVAYGDPSRRAFLRRAMGSAFNGPWLEKGSFGVYPLVGVPITVGSLSAPSLSVTEFTGGSTTVAMNLTFPALEGGEGVTYPSTVGFLSQLLISSGLALAGDQITIIAGFISMETYDWNERSFYVSTADTTPLANIGVGFSALAAGATTANVFFSLLPGSAPSATTTLPNVVAVAISRDGDGVRLRSTADFVYTDGIGNLTVYSPAAQVLAMDSYRSSDATDSDWQLTRTSSGGSTIVVQTRGGLSVVGVAIRQVGNYVELVSQSGQLYYIFIGDARIAGFNRYINSLSTNTRTAPADATDDNTITTGEDTEVSLAFQQWWVGQGGNLTAFYTQGA